MRNKKQAKGAMLHIECVGGCEIEIMYGFKE